MALIDTLQKELNSINEAITYEELNDRAYTRHYTMLLRKRRIIRKAIKQLLNAERRCKQ